MSKVEKKFWLDAPIHDSKGKLLAYARIDGVGYMHKAYIKDFENQLCEPEDIFSFDIEKVVILMNDKAEECTNAYRLSKKMLSDLADAIDKPTLAHMEYIFATPAPDTIDFPTPTELDIERNSSLLK